MIAELDTLYSFVNSQASGSPSPWHRRCTALVHRVHIDPYKRFFASDKTLFHGGDMSYHLSCRCDWCIATGGLLKKEHIKGFSCGSYLSHGCEHCSRQIPKPPLEIIALCHNPSPRLRSSILDLPSSILPLSSLRSTAHPPFFRPPCRRQLDLPERLREVLQRLDTVLPLL
jgi:hypothetical protein